MVRRLVCLASVLAACGQEELALTTQNAEELFVAAMCVHCHAAGGLAEFAPLVAGKAKETLVGQDSFVGWIDTMPSGPERDWLSARIGSTTGWQRVAPGEPERSWLLVRTDPDAPPYVSQVRTDGTTELVAFRMPRGRGPLPRAWHQFLRDWIAAGAP